MDRKKFDLILDEYYGARGWNEKTGLQKRKLSRNWAWGRSPRIWPGKTGLANGDPAQAVPAPVGHCRRFRDGPDPEDPATIRNVVDALVSRFGPAMERHLFDRSGRIIPSWAVFMNEKIYPLNQPHSLEAPVRPEDEVSFLLNVAEDRNGRGEDPIRGKYAFPKIPAKNLAIVFDPPFPSPISDLSSAILRALDEPVAGLPFSARLGRGKRVLILIDNFARLTPADKILPPILDKLGNPGLESRSW